MRLRRAFARLLSHSLIAAALAWHAPARAQDESGRARIPAYAGFVTDSAGVLSETRAAELEGFLDQLQRKTGVQFAVLTVPSCAPEDPQAYKTRVFNEWGIGNAERDDGLLLLVAMEERQIRFETGYGLEGTLPDGWQSRMVRDLAVPRFRAGEPAEGITAAVLSCAQRIAAEKGVALEWDGKPLRYDSRREPLPRGFVFLLAFLVLFVLIPLFTLPRLRGRRGWYSSGGGWGGGWGGGFGGSGGGFSGGGGSSFGGFGGGSSGGGGGGGGW